MTIFEQWCRAVEARDERIGEIALSNLRYDAFEDRVDRSVRASFRQRLEDLHSANPGPFPELLIQKVAREQPADYFCQGPQARFDQCSRIIPAQDFVHENVDLEAAGGWQIEDFVPEDYLEVLETGLQGLAMGTIPSDPFRHFAWVTRTGEIRRLRAEMPEDEVAITARNRCGLLHHAKSAPIRLVEVQYPEAGLGTTLHAPTFLEGAPYAVYVSKAGQEEWGTALDLAEIRDGMSEAVHRRVEFTGGFTMKRLGWALGEIEVDSKRVLAHMPKAWDGDYLSLEALFQ